jgi:ActR/RegA family two-component response regulator
MGESKADLVQTFNQVVEFAEPYLLVTEGDDRALQAISIATGEREFKLESHGNYAEGIAALTSSDIAYADVDGSVCRWNAVTGLCAPEETL